MGMNEGMHEGKRQFEMDILTEATYLQLSKKQHVLDTKIKEKQGITDLSLDRIQLAYAIEVGECVNEMKGDVKYWSNKPIRGGEFLEEFVDALHFFLSFVNHQLKQDIEYGDKATLPGRYKRFAYIAEKMEERYGGQNQVWGYAYLVLMRSDIYESFALMSILVEEYGFTEQNIIDTYNKKNAVNHERSDSGVY